MPQSNSPRNKVQTAIEKYELGTLGDELERRWKGEGFEGHSTRELAEYFNRTLLREAIAASGSIALDGEIESIYELMTDDDTRPGETVQAENRLAEYDVDAEEIQADLVSHQTMYRYLKQIREIDTSKDQKSTDELINATRQSIQRLSSRTQSVVKNNLSKLNNRDEFALGEFDVFVNIQVSCNDCGTTREITELLDQRGCECRENT